MATADMPPSESWDDSQPAGWDDAPPSDDWGDAPPPENYQGDWDDPGYEGPPPGDTPTRSERPMSPARWRAERKRQVVQEALTRSKVDVVDTLRRVLAAQQGRPMGDLRDQVNQINAAEQVLNQLDERARAAYRGVLEILLDVAVNCEGGTVDLHYLPHLDVYDESVQQEVAAIRTFAGNDGLTAHPAIAWFALRESVQRAEAERSTLDYLESLRNGEIVEDAVAKFKAIEPPTTKKADVRARAAKTATQIIDEARAASAGKPKMRLSSGYRTLDVALTRSGEPLGFIAPGEGFVVAGPTGTGKSSWTYGVVPAMCQDLVNYGFPEAKIIFAHTEEESIDKVEAMDMNKGGAFQRLSDNLVVANVGTSRQLLAMTIYDCVVWARQMSLETGRPIAHFLPYALILDYIQSLSEQGETETVATLTTAEFLLRGVQMWNPDEMEKFSGVSYREYTGSPWPEGMEHHRVAGIYMAQLVKQDDSSLLYKAGDKKSQLSDFALEDPSDDPVWTGPDKNGYAWDVRENDLRLFKQNAIRGHGAILQNATSILILHRSRAYNNPQQKEKGPDGRFHLEDVRARFLLDKTRNGASLMFVPMSFDLDYKGFKARYIDVAAEKALAQGLFKVDAESFTRSGDPLLPVRVAPSPFSTYRY